jgi:nitrate reductase beta subunit
VRVCQAQLTRQEFVDWQAYAALEPWGEDRMDLRFSHLMALIANIVRDPKKPAYQPKDFLFDFLSDPDAAPDEPTAQWQTLLEQVTLDAGEHGKMFEADASEEEMEAFLLEQMGEEY